MEAADHGKAHLGSEVGVFAIGFLAASPTGITEDVDVGRPEGETLVALDVARAFRLLGFHAGLVADGGEHLMEQGVVPRGGHTHGDGEDGGKTVAPYTVEGFVPPLELGDAQTGDGG